jgi:very-short-patch-repair endonuclease
MRWSWKILEERKKDGKIKDFTESMVTSENKKVVKLPSAPSKEITWLKWQLWYWCMKNKCELKEEYQFNEKRKWRFDFAIIELKIAVEYEGGIWLQGGGAHSRPANIERDIAKYNLAQSEGWKVVRVHSKTYKTVLQELEKLRRESENG